MKKVRHIWALLLVLGGLLATSCYKDLGNYDYLDLDEITIDTANQGILPSYAVFRYDTLEIAPRVLLNGQPITNESQASGKLGFTWVIFQATTGGHVYSRDTLSQELHLKAPILKPAGQWVVVLSVKDLETQVESYQRFSLQVDEVLSDGWMILYETGGNTDVGLIVDDWSKRGVVQPRTFSDIIKNSNGQPLLGEPRALLHSASPLATGEILVASANDMAAFDKSSFEVVFPFEKLFWSPPAKGEIKAIATTMTRKEVVIHNNRLHVVNFASSGTARTNYFGAALLGEYGELAEWLPTFFGATADGVVYDKTNKRYLYVPTNGSTVQPFPPQNPTFTSFDVNNVGLDPVAFDWGWQNREYSVMTDANNHYLLAANFMLPTLDRLGAAKYTITGLPSGTKVSTMSAAQNGQYVLLGAGQHVYLYKYDTGLPATTEWTAPSGEEVTTVRIQKFYHAALAGMLLPMPSRVVYISTWNESTKTGKIYAYLIDPTSGAINKGSERVYTGFGKVKEMGYKWLL